jgi:hypothetical protein
MTLRRLEVQIRKLCEQALRAEEPELEAIFEELRAALHEHNQLLRKLVTDRLSLQGLSAVPNPPPRKRNLH